MAQKGQPGHLGEHPSFVSLVLVACLLALSAGFLNGVFLITSATFVSSVNGLLSLIARDFVLGVNVTRGALLLAQVATFFAGCAVAGFAYDRPLEVESSHFVGLAGVGVGMFFCVGIFVGVGNEAAKTGAVFIAAFTMGFQNALGASFSKGLLRTTHQTGSVTDLGLDLGEWIRLTFWEKKPFANGWKVRAKLSVTVAYFCGGFAGVASVQYGSFLYLCLPAGIVVVGALAGLFAFRRCGAKGSSPSISQQFDISTIVL